MKKILIGATLLSGVAIAHQTGALRNVENAISVKGMRLLDPEDAHKVIVY
jgi:hypothetical protein